MRKILTHLPRLLILPLFITALFLTTNSTITSADDQPDLWTDFLNQPEITYADSMEAHAMAESTNLKQDIYGTLKCEGEASVEIASEYNYTDQCWYKTGAGWFLYGGSGYKATDSEYGGFTDGSQTLVYPTMNMGTLLEWSNDGSNSAKLRRDTALEYTFQRGYPNDYSWNNPASLEFRYEDGGDYEFSPSVTYARVNYSNDGRWMVVWNDTGWIIRVDLVHMKFATYRVLSEADSHYAAIGISDSGRYIAINNYGTHFIVLDTQGCTTSLDRIRIPEEATCAMTVRQDFDSEYWSKISNSMPYFYEDGILGLRSPDGSETIMQDPQVKRTSHYVALGDSFASGEGAGNYLYGTDTANQHINTCHTSTKSYPYYVANRASVDSFFSVACSGAKIENFWQWAQKPLTPTPYGPMFPGTVPQINTLSNADIVTITMSGNDIGFVDKLTYCLMLSVHCYNSYEERLEIANEVKDQYPRLVSMYKAILGTGINKRRLYVVGYPQIVNFSENAKCDANVNFNPYQRQMITELITYFNAVIREAAREAGAFYVGVENALGDYKLCGSPYRTSAMNGLTFGNEAPLMGIGPFSNSSYHPNSLGQRLLGEKVLEQTNSLRKGMPRASSYAEVPEPYNYPFLNVPKRNGIVHRIRYNVIVDNAFVQRGIPFIVRVVKEAIVHGPNSTVRFVLMSDPTDLGEGTVREDGTIEASLTIPANTPPGMHELRIDGVDESGEPVSLRQFVLVYAESDDYDGDGIGIDEEVCGEFITPLHEDFDQNGADDACNDRVRNSFVKDSSAQHHATASPATDSTTKVFGTTTDDVMESDTRDFMPNTQSSTHDETTKTNHSQSFIVVVLCAIILALAPLGYRKFHIKEN